MVQDGLIVAFFNCGTSVFAACVIFALLGGSAQTSFDQCVANQKDYVRNFLNQPENFLSENSTEEIFNKYGEELELEKCDFEEILLGDIPQGTGLTFIAIARAVVEIPASYIFAILFYALITMLGIGSMLGTLEGVLTPVVDAMQGYKKTRTIPKSMTMLALVVLHFSIGILFTTDAGNYWLDIFNDYSANINLLVCGLMQYIVIYLVFGGGLWVSEMKWMIGGDSKFIKGFTWYLRICGTVISPLLIAVIVVAFLYDMIQNPPGYRQWDPEIGSWAKDESGEDARFAYSSAGTATIVLLHVAVLVWIPLNLLKPFFKNGFSFSNWKKHPAFIYLKKEE